MNTTRRPAAIAAVLFLIALVLNIIATSIYKPVLDGPDYLAAAYPDKTSVMIGVLLDFTCAPAMILIPVVLFPILKMFSERIALGYVAFRLLEGKLHIYLAVNSLSLISLSQGSINAGALFYYLLYASKLIPRWLSGWGFLAVALLLTGALLHMFGLFVTRPLMAVMPYFAPPIGLQELVMAVWLIFKGFDPAAIESPQIIAGSRYPAPEH